MAYSIIGADRRTHFKIVGVALAAAFLVVAVGMTARHADFEGMTAMLGTGPVIKAGRPAAVAGQTPTVR